MSKNSIDSVTEEEAVVVTTTSLSGVDDGDPLQEVTPLQSESLGVNEMSSPTTSNEEEGLDEHSFTSQPSNINANSGDDVTPSMEGKSQLRNFLSVAKAKWDNVPQGWMQQRTSRDNWRSLGSDPVFFVCNYLSRQLPLSESISICWL